MKPRNERHTVSGLMISDRGDSISRTSLFRFIFIALLTFCFGSCSSPPSEHPPNVLLIVIDTLRADHLGCYGYERDTTPNIDRLSRKGVLFQEVYCQTPLTSPSVASILTSRYPRVHGVFNNQRILSDTYPTLSEELKATGYTTGAIVSSFVLSSEFGYSRGFDYFDDGFSDKGSTLHFRSTDNSPAREYFDQTADITTQKAIDWIHQHKEEKFFLWVHYFDPHTPYLPPDRHVADFLKESYRPFDNIVANYDGEIRFADEEIGNLLKALRAEGLDSRTLIVLMSDHGEGLGQHDKMEHGGSLYEEQTRIPLIMAWQGVLPKDRSIKQPAQSIDVFPTILDLLGLANKQPLSGKSLVESIRNPEAQFDHTIFLERKYRSSGSEETQVYRERFGLRHSDMKYIWTPHEKLEELYDLQKDTREIHNMAETNPEVIATMRTMVEAWKKDEAAGRIEAQLVDQETRERLKAIGYIE